MIIDRKVKFRFFQLQLNSRPSNAVSLLRNYSLLEAQMI